MNIAGLIMLAVIGCAAWACLKSDWSEFDESTDDDDNDPYDGSNGI